MTPHWGLYAIDYQPCLSSRNCLTYCFLVVLSIALRISSWVWWYWAKIQGGLLLISCSLLLQEHHPVATELGSSSPQFRGTAGLSVPPPSTVAWKLPQAESGAIVGLTSFDSFFSGMTGLCCLLSNGWTRRFTNFVCFSRWWQWEGNSKSS